MGLSKFKIKYREFVDILRHEYHYIFHDGGVLLVVVGAILIYSTAYSFAYKNEVLRDIPIAIVDNSQTPSSRQITVRSMRRRTCAWLISRPVSKRRKSCFTSARSTE